MSFAVWQSSHFMEIFVQKNNTLTLGDFSPELLKAYDDPDGDIMWRAGIARAAAILMKKPSGDIAAIINLLRYSDRPASHDKLMQDAATLLSRIPRAIDELLDMIDGGEECRGIDSQISSIIRILEGDEY